MRKKYLVWLALGALLLALCSSTARSHRKSHGSVFFRPPHFPPYHPGWMPSRQGLLELGYVEGKNIYY